MSWSQSYTNGTLLYHSAAASAFEMHGAILARYNSLTPDIQNALGYLVSDESPATNTTGRKNVFSQGAIY
jgi:hypothetical protein